MHLAKALRDENAQRRGRHPEYHQAEEVFRGDHQGLPLPVSENAQQGGRVATLLLHQRPLGRHPLCDVDVDGLERIFNVDFIRFCKFLKICRFGFQENIL